MALNYDLPVYTDVYRLIRRIFQYTRDLSRENKHTVGKNLRRDSVVLLRSVDFKILPMKKQTEPADLIDGIGRQIASWRNAALQQPQSRRSRRP